MHPDDADLVAACAAVIDIPKADPPTSFELHAPLELLARALLLERLPDEHRAAAHDRLRSITDQYAAAGPGVAEPPPLTATAEEMVLSLAAAGHAPILASVRQRVSAVAPTFGDALVATELARYPTWMLRWPLARSAGGARTADLAERLARPRSPGDPGSNFIYPTMHLVDESGLAAEVLDAPLRGMGVDEARVVLLRIAAQSMLQDDPAAAPYGWTHCLTMPQAVLAAADHGADPDIAVAVAATYVLGFRATLGRVRIDPEWSPARDNSPDLTDELTVFGALHPDAHVAKYTLACFDAAEADPDARSLYLAAAAHLHDWWRTADLGAAG
jgi:hypothetical protein